MDESLREHADRIFEEALKSSGARDPRDFYRQTLRGLREANPQGYDQAVEHYQNTLVPGIASGEMEPLRAWREYGRRLAELTAGGRTVEIDGTGRARPYTPDAPLDRMVLHLPEGRGPRALLVALPPHPSPAQRASYELLVAGRLRLSEELTSPRPGTGE